MLRFLSICGVLALLPLCGRGQEQPKDLETLIRLSVQAAPAPKPALRYALLPELREMHPGNPVLGFLKCFMEQEHFFSNKEAVEERIKLEAMPLEELAGRKLRNYGGIALRQADQAARLDTPDWQILRQLKTDGIHLLIPDVQKMRDLAWALKVRFRTEVAGGRCDDALVTARTMFALARVLGEHPTLIGDLVGLAIVGLTIDPLEELLQQPGCPNLYWAFTQLPPLIDLRNGLQGERVLMMDEFAMLDEKMPMSQAQLQTCVQRLQTILGAMQLTEGLAAPNSSAGPVQGPGVKDPGPRRLSDWLADRAADPEHTKAARLRLVEYGLAKQDVERFPPLQVLLLDGKVLYETLRDESMKAMTLPYWQAEPFLLAHPAKKAEASPFAALVPKLIRVRQAQARIEQRLALLRCVEALRLYAAEHDGKLPAKLADVAVPLPADPVTGRPFLYEVEAGAAHLRGTPPSGMEKIAGYNIHVQVNIVKKAVDFLHKTQADSEKLQKAIDYLHKSQKVYKVEDVEKEKPTDPVTGEFLVEESIVIQRALRSTGLRYDPILLQTRTAKNDKGKFQVFLVGKALNQLHHVGIGNLPAHLRGKVVQASGKVKVTTYPRFSTDSGDRAVEAPEERWTSYEMLIDDLDNFHVILHPANPARPDDDLAAKNKATAAKMLEQRKKAALAAAEFEYPGAKKLDQRGAGAVYQCLSTTTDDLSKVAGWYDKKLANLIAGQSAGAEGDGDGTRRSISQDGGRPDLEAIAQRPVSTRCYLVRSKSHTVSVVICRPPSETLTVVSLTYLPELADEAKKKAGPE